MSKNITLGISPCPNDTFMFYNLLHMSEWSTNNLQLTIADVEDLNKLCLRQALDISKVSFHVFGKLRKEYGLLSAGCALGRGCGPLIICKSKPKSLSGKTIAVPGLNTTAYLLLKCFAPDDIQIKEMLFSDIMPAVLAGEVDAGLIIHESRFTYKNFDLQLIVDLGEWWEDVSKLPIPLGGIIASRNLSHKLIEKFNEDLSQSIKTAQNCNWQEQPEMMKFILKHSQEIAPDVLTSHIETYVNSESTDLSDEGILAIEKLFQTAEKRGFIPQCDLPLMATRS